MLAKNLLKEKYLIVPFTKLTLATHFIFFMALLGKGATIQLTDVSIKS